MGKKIILICFLLLFSLSNSKLEENFVQLPMNVICSNLEDPLNEAFLFGKDESAFSFKTDYLDTSNIFDSQKIEADTQFEASISKENDTITYKLSCRLWKADDNRINSICRFKGQAKDGLYLLNNASFIYNNNYNIVISSKCSAFKIIQYDFNIPFLYAPKQVINNTNDKDFFELKFNIELYNDEKLILFRMKGRWDQTFDLENCEKMNKQITCKVSKELFLTNARESLQYSYLITVIKGLVFPYMFEGVDEIKVNNNIEKKDIYVQITKLLQKVTENYGTIVYETNVTDILDLTFYEFKVTTSNLDLYCTLKKVKKDPLFFICSIGRLSPGDKTLGDIKQTIVIEDDNINYKFFILPVNNSEVFKVLEGKGGFPFYSHPQTFDYTKESSVLLFSVGDRLDNVEGISLNIEKGNLSCTYAKNFFRCDVPKSHFDGKANGDYYFYYTNKLGERMRLYGLSPAKVILSEKENYSTWFNKSTILVFALLCLLF